MSPSSEEEYFYKLENMVIRSTKYLHQVFKQRWKVEREENWMDEPINVYNFILQHCGSVPKKAIALQKKTLLESCSLDDWDISLISLVLLNFGDGTKYKCQNQAVRTLKIIRNDLAHHKSKKLTQNEYREKVKIFKEILQVLEVTENDLDKLIKESSLRSSLEGTERLNVLLENAEKFIKSRDFERALNQYSEAITMPRLSPESLGSIYEKRADCYINMKDKRLSNEKHIDQAILDVDKALSLNKSSWNAHYLKAQCHRKKNNLSEAIRFFEMALAISPIQKQVKNDFDSCLVLDAIHKSNANINLDALPVSGSDFFGLKYAKSNGYQNSPVYLGDKYYHGIDVPQDYAKAFKYYSQAGKKGYAEGVFHVAQCYYLGHGVKQDIAESVEILKRCANMDAKKILDFETSTPLDYNNSVASAEYALGNGYEHGVGVEKNVEEAVSWYTKAIEHGQSEAAGCLGYLYFNDIKGLTQNHKMAEMCWKQGLNLGDTESAEKLAIYYSYHLEPEMVWNMFRIGREMGSSKFLNISDEDFNQNLTAIQSKRCRLDEQVTSFEQEHNIGFKGMTFWQRVTRSDQYLETNFAKFMSSYVNNNDSLETQKVRKDVEMAMGLKGIYDNMISLMQQSKKGWEPKEYINSPVRKGLISQHRERTKNAMDLRNQNLNKTFVLVDDGVVPGKLQQKRANKIALLKSITLQEMNPTQDKIYENRIVDLTFIEEPNVYSNSIQLIAEDDNGDTTRVYLDTVAAKVISIHRFSAGCRIAVINPYMGICAKNRVNGILINEHKCVLPLEKLNAMCRFCGEENSTRKCSKCKRLYCSRECQKLDWQLFEHKLICE